MFLWNGCRFHTTTTLSATVAIANDITRGCKCMKNAIVCRDNIISPWAIGASPHRYMLTVCHARTRDMHLRDLMMVASYALKCNTLARVLGIPKWYESSILFMVQVLWWVALFAARWVCAITLIRWHWLWFVHNILTGCAGGGGGGNWRAVLFSSNNAAKVSSRKRLSCNAWMEYELVGVAACMLVLRSFDPVLLRADAHRYICNFQDLRVRLERCKWCESDGSTIALSWVAPALTLLSQSNLYIRMI